MRVAVSSSVLRWALQRSGRRAVIEQKYPKLSEWLQNKSQPTFRQLEGLAKATATPLGYFFLSEPPDDRLPVPHFRTLDADSPPVASPDLLETVQTMERRQAWLREHLIEIGHDPLPFVGSAKLTDDPRRVARKMKDVLGLKDGWAAKHPSWLAALRELQCKSEDAGIVVVVNSVVGNNTHRKLSVSEFRGFVLVDQYAPLVFLNGADGKAAQMFTLAHELAHVMMGSSAVFDLRELQPADDVVEQVCNRVAAEFLVPEDEMRKIWPSVGHGSGCFQEIARRFKVSELVAARRALDLNLIAQNEFLEFYQAYLKHERYTNAQDHEGGNFYATQNLRIGRRFAEAVVRAVREGRLLYHEAYQLTGLYGKAFARYAEFLGFEEQP
jgi:Zn-dependent peptidase ImmA (M78 family)/transcriptional regulator with XRE-family HTH domain